MKLRKYLGIVQYEFRMQWRVRAPLVIMIGMAVLPILFAFQYRNEFDTNRSILISTGSLSTVEISRMLTAGVVATSWPAIYIVLASLLPILTAEAMPKEHHFGTSELVSSLPISYRNFLIGKVLSVYGAMIFGILSTMIFVGISWRIILGSFHLQTFATTWLVGGSLMVVLNAGLSTILASPLKSRKGAYFLGAGLAISSIILLMVSLAAQPSYFWETMNPARPLLFGYFLFGVQDSGGLIPGLRQYIPTDVWWTLIVGTAQLLFAYWAVFLWKTRKQEI